MAKKSKRKRYRATFTVEYSTKDRAAAGKLVRDRALGMMEDLFDNPLIEDPGMCGTSSEEIEDE